MDFSGAEPVIEPAPAQVLPPHRSPPLRTPEQEESRKQNIRSFDELSLGVQTALLPFSQLMTLQANMDPDIKIITELNQLSFMMLAGKGIVTRYINDAFADIVDPPRESQAARVEVLDRLEAITAQFLTTMQNAIVHCQSNHRGLSPLQGPSHQ
jgi:hypothetical protein